MSVENLTLTLGLVMTVTVTNVSKLCHILDLISSC